jgi:hypothetical protein
VKKFILQVFCGAGVQLYGYRHGHFCEDPFWRLQWAVGLSGFPRR